MTTLASLAPKTKKLVMDLVREAGHDVSAWGHYKKGPPQAASNPKFCYEWAFEQPPAAPIVNLWHAQMEEHASVIQVRANLRASVARYTGGGAHPLWRARAKRLDGAFQKAFGTASPVRVILNAGRMRIPNDPEAKASAVDLRELDPSPWHVAQYESETGDTLLIRGAPSGRYVDQFTEPVLAERRETAPGFVYVRSPLVRSRALERAKGICEFCNAPGFSRLDGTIYLETHHIVPLEEGGTDRLPNVAALCPNHHREAHSGARRDFIRADLLQRVGEKMAIQH